MIQTVEAVVDAAGRVRLLGEVHIDGPRRALATVLEEPAAVPGVAALLAEGPSQLVITPAPDQARGSVADAFGTAAVLRAGDEILAQVRAERDEWGER